MNLAKTTDYDYFLPKELIAQQPAARREEARLMVLSRSTGIIKHRTFSAIGNYLQKDDLLVVNNTKVIPARLIGSRNGSQKTIEILLVKQLSGGSWNCLLKPQRGLKPGQGISFKDNSLQAEIKERLAEGTWIIDFRGEEQPLALGYAPLPPYIKRDYTRADHQAKDKQRYQTVYAREAGAIAAPTAGLHFTEKLLAEIENKGVMIAPVTLHVGRGTFIPVRTDFINEHKMLPESFSIPPETTKKINKAKRVIAVGTTTTRALETTIAGSGETDLFITPPYKFRIVNALITNLHLPKSTLLMLVSAFAGRDLIRQAYQEAIQHKYRFYSYGDAMLIL